MEGGDKVRDIRDLNLVGTTGSNRRVETKDDGSDNQEIVVRYPRPAAGLSADEKARFASLASKGLAHLGFHSEELSSFVQKQFSAAEETTKAAAAPCTPETITVDGVKYVKA